MYFAAVCDPRQPAASAGFSILTSKWIACARICLLLCVDPLSRASCRTGERADGPGTDHARAQVQMNRDGERTVRQARLRRRRPAARCMSSRMIVWIGVRVDIGARMLACIRIRAYKKANLWRARTRVFLHITCVRRCVHVNARALTRMRACANEDRFCCSRKAARVRRLPPRSALSLLVSSVRSLLASFAPARSSPRPHPSPGLLPAPSSAHCPPVPPPSCPPRPPPQSA